MKKSGKSQDTKSKDTKKETPAAQADGVNAFRARHLRLADRDIMMDGSIRKITVNETESPLAWLARRKGRDGCCMIDQYQFIAGEKLRADFTAGQLSPRVTSSWSVTGRARGVGSGAGEMTDFALASRQRLRHALEACGPEFSGLLMDVCCFLRGLEDIERERKWPARSAKVVLQLGLDRLARHYGLRRDGAGAATAAHIRTWLAEDAGFTT